MVLPCLKSDIQRPLVLLKELRVKMFFNSWYIIKIYTKSVGKLSLTETSVVCFWNYKQRRHQIIDLWNRINEKLLFRSTTVDVESHWSAEHLKMAFCSILQQISVDLESRWSAERWCLEHWSSSGWSVDMHSVQLCTCEWNGFALFK